MMPTDDELSWASLEQLRHWLDDGSISAVELMTHTLDRVDAMNGAMNALVALDGDLAMSGAEMADRRIRVGGRVPILTGIPTAVKDLSNAIGFVTSRGTKAFVHSAKQSVDSIDVARMRAAGAIVIAKTNAPPFGAAIHTTNEAYGVSRNPWDTTRSPGGSSGGAAAAVAAGLIPLATAGDGGGSTRIPAALCGIVGMKPTRGLVPSEAGEIENWTHHSTSTPMARTVRDTALHLDLIVGLHSADPYSLPRPAELYADALRRSPGRIRVGVHRDFGVTSPTADVLRALEAAVDVLRYAGHEIVDLDLPVPGHEDFAASIVRRQAVLGLSRRMRAQAATAEQPVFEDWFQAILDRGRAVTNEELGEYWRHRAALSAWTARLFASVDVLLSPTTPTTAWPADGPDIPAAVANGWIPTAFTSVFNDAGNPAISVPAGLGADGLPIGVQLAARHFDDALILQVALQLEEAMPASHPFD